MDTGRKKQQAPYSDESPFVRLLGTPGRVRILDAFLTKYMTEMSASDISNLTGVSKSTFSRNKDVLQELDLIEQSSNKGGEQFYKLNLDSSLATLLGDFHTQLLNHSDHVKSKTEIRYENYVGRLFVTEASIEMGHSSEGESSSDETEFIKQVTKDA